MTSTKSLDGDLADDRAVREIDKEGGEERSHSLADGRIKVRRPNGNGSESSAARGLTVSAPPRSPGLPFQRRPDPWLITGTQARTGTRSSGARNGTGPGRAGSRGRIYGANDGIAPC